MAYRRMKIVCTVSHDTATLIRPNAASMNWVGPRAACAWTSTTPTATRLATLAHEHEQVTQGPVGVFGGGVGWPCPGAASAR